ncbi:glycoside hydrolase family 5 C-terminal domain-containing protein [Microdochium nivale]|nr:glycoside hydrolase family 5 C-terminal domain-containing protein [Microdochium nivale]
MSSLRLTIEDGEFRDHFGRHVMLRGINVAGDAKVPSEPNVPTHEPLNFFDGDNVRFHNRPFPKEEAHIHFTRLKRFGYNTIRYVFTWEAIEAAGPGKYDEQWIQHTIDVLREAKDFGFYIFMDPHQDVWSRFCGGSGAPMWTVYACGLDPQKLAVTEASIVHNTYSDPEKFPKMIWSTNYNRLACATIFTMFFGGRDFAPKCIIDGVNIQDYLQGHFMRACEHLAKRIHEAGDLENDVVFGWESLNEPNRCLIGYHDISVIPAEQNLKKGTSPTIWQAILTGSGRACEVESWDMGGLGPYKVGRVLVDPRGEKAWLSADYDDSRYGWKRDPDWKMGECIWAQHGVWDPSNDVLLRKDYFTKNPNSGKAIDYPEFTNTYFMEFYRKYRDTIRAIHKDAIMLCQPPTLEVPPNIKGTADDDPKMVYAPHYYDGITLMTKKWNRTWNVDVFGVLRGRYLHPAFAIKIGETAIRNSFKEQLTAMRKEGLDNMGNHPVMLTEFGIPYDMDDKAAYKTGDYSSQSAAMDANHFAVEGSHMEGYTLWLYCSFNNHHNGDQWNGEDLSIFSEDDQTLPETALPQETDAQTSDGLLGVDTARKSGNSETSVTPANLKRTLTNPSISSERSSPNPELTNAPGYRAADAYVRPAPIYINGTIIDYVFDLRNCQFTLNVEGTKMLSDETPTVVFLPEWHFPKEQCTVEVSGGKWEISTDDEERALVQKLRWWHSDGKQTLRIKGLVRPRSTLAGTSEEAGYLEQCQSSYGIDLKSCSVM